MSTPGFAVIYRWRLRAGSEERFREAWHRLTLAIREQRGGLGSRLHQVEDGTWLAYAAWPDRQSWERGRELPPPDLTAFEAMGACIEESLPPLTLEPVADLLGGSPPAPRP